jgi:methylase of polypeptide subunit release factors
MLSSTSQILRDSVIDRCNIDYREPMQMLETSVQLQADYYFSTIATQDSNEIPKPILRAEADRLFFSKRCQLCLRELELRTEEHNKLLEHRMKLMDLFAGGGGLSLGLTSNARMCNSVSLDISPSAALTLR